MEELRYFLRRARTRDLASNKSACTGAAFIYPMDPFRSQEEDQHFPCCCMSTITNSYYRKNGWQIELLQMG